MKIMLPIILLTTHSCYAMQHEELKKAIQDNDHQKVHEILQTQKTLQVPTTATPTTTPTLTPPQTRTASPSEANPLLGKFEALENIDLAHLENPRNLLVLAQEAEELAQVNAGTYGNMYTIGRGIAGLLLIAYGGFQLAVNFGYLQEQNDPDNSKTQNILNGALNSSGCATAFGLGAQQLYLAFTKRDAIDNHKNATIITHLVKNSNIDTQPPAPAPTH